MQHDTVLQLSCFAHKTTPPSARAPDAAPSQARPASLVKKHQPGDVPDSQLVQLSKCIVCGLDWTSRKTANQKRTHIRQCAKKHALTKDTIRILVDKEIAILSPAQTTVSSRTDLNETTLMNSVAPTGPAKKSKRQQVLATVKSLPETRGDILNRARDILGPTDDQAELQLTQQFGQSALARRNTRHLQPRALFDVNRSIGEPSCTQSFGASSLRAGAIGAEQLASAREESPFMHYGTSLFAQDSLLSGSGHKRRASPLASNDSESRIVRQRLLE